MVALGGDVPPCLAAVDLWHDAIADGGFLAEWVDQTNLGRTRLSWLAMALERLRGEGFHEFLRDLTPKRAERMGTFLVRFPQPFLDRAAAAVAEAIVDGDGVACARAAELLPISISHRLRRSFVTAVGNRQLAVGAAALVPLKIVVDPDADVAMHGTLTGAERGIAMVVRAEWLHRVWAAEADVIDGRLTLDLTDGWATVVDWEPTGDGRAVPRLSRQKVEPALSVSGHGRWMISAD